MDFIDVKCTKGDCFIVHDTDNLIVNGISAYYGDSVELNAKHLKTNSIFFEATRGRF